MVHLASGDQVVISGTAADLSTAPTSAPHRVQIHSANLLQLISATGAAANDEVQLQLMGSYTAVVDGQSVVHTNELLAEEQMTVRTLMDHHPPRGAGLQELLLSDKGRYLVRLRGVFVADAKCTGWSCNGQLAAKPSVFRTNGGWTQHKLYSKISRPSDNPDFAEVSRQEAREKYAFVAEPPVPEDEHDVVPIHVLAANLLDNSAVDGGKSMWEVVQASGVDGTASDTSGCGAGNLPTQCPTLDQKGGVNVLKFSASSGIQLGTASSYGISGAFSVLVTAVLPPALVRGQLFNIVHRTGLADRPLQAAAAFGRLLRLHIHEQTPQGVLVQCCLGAKCVNSDRVPLDDKLVRVLGCIYKPDSTQLVVVARDSSKGYSQAIGYFHRNLTTAT